MLRSSSSSKKVAKCVDIDKCHSNDILLFFFLPCKPTLSSSNTVQMLGKKHTSSLSRKIHFTLLNQSVSLLGVCSCGRLPQRLLWMESVYCVADAYFVECQNWQDAPEAVVGIPSQVNVEVNYLQYYTTSLKHPLCYCDLEQQTESKAAPGELFHTSPWPLTSLQRDWKRSFHKDQWNIVSLFVGCAHLCSY